jgi:hypothetical protein
MSGTYKEAFKKVYVSGAILLLTAILVALAIPAKAQRGGPYDLTWNTMDGGDFSIGGTFALRGVIGQPDAGWMSGGAFTIQGGFLVKGLEGTPSQRWYLYP